MVRSALLRAWRDPRRSVRALIAAVVGMALAQGIWAAPAFAGTGSMLYHGGANGAGVMTAPQVYLVFWGTQWGSVSTDANGDTALSADSDNAMPGIQEFFKGLGTDDEQWSGIMTQYCEGVPATDTFCPSSDTQHVGYPTGGALAGVWADQDSAAPAQASRTDLANEAVRAAGHFGNTTQGANNNAVYVVASAPGTDPDSFKEQTSQTGYCMYHNWIGGSTYGSVAYVNMPYLIDNPACSGGTMPLVDKFVWRLSHEYAEAITDPFFSGWFDASGSAGEIGDKCFPSGPVSLTLATGTFQVQQEWSNDANNVQGQCAVSHPIVQGGGIVNGGFETGGTGLFNGSLFGWAAAGTAGLGSSHTGSFAAQLGSPSAVSGQSTLSQTFTAPANTNTLSFWYRSVCPRVAYADEWTEASLTDLTVSTGSIALYNTCVADSGWVPVNTPVTPGDSYQLTFTNQDAGIAGQTSYTLIDDVSVINGDTLTTPSWTQVTSYGLVTWDTTNLTPYITAGYIISRDGDYAVATVPGTAYYWQDPVSDGRAHTYRVRAYATNSPPTHASVSAPSPTTTEPPVDLYPAGPARICWDGVVSHDAPGDAYHVYVDGSKIPADSVPATEGQVCWNVKYNSFNAIGWDSGTKHSISVATYNPAVNGGADESGWSDALSYTYLDPPSGVTAAQQCTFAGKGVPCKPWVAALVKWQSVTGAASYNVHRNGALVAPGLITNYGAWVDTGVSAGTVYTYQVSAVASDGSESSLSSPATTTIQ